MFLFRNMFVGIKIAESAVVLFTSLYGRDHGLLPRGKNLGCRH